MMLPGSIFQLKAIKIYLYHWPLIRLDVYDDKGDYWKLAFLSERLYYASKIDGQCIQQMSRLAIQEIKELIERVETVSKYATDLKAEFKKETDFLHAENEALKTRLAESDNLVSEFMASVLDTPTKEPVVKVKNAFAKVEKNNPFLTRKK